MVLLQKQQFFFQYSAKQQNFLEKSCEWKTTSVKVKYLCRTRWIYWHEACENFFMLFEYLL